MSSAKHFTEVLIGGKVYTLSGFEGEEYLQNQRYPVFKTHIRRTEKADEVTFTTQSLMQYSPRSGAARDYKTFVKEYLEG